MSAEVIGLVASVVFLARLMPQPIRLARTGVPDGVSPLAMMNGVSSDIGWILYGLSVALLPVWGVAVVALVPGIWTVALLRSRVTRRDLIGAAVWLTTIGIAWQVGRLAFILGLSVIVNHGPSVWVALRSRRLEGISRTTWLIAIADASLWGGYGIATGDPALMGYGSVLLSAAATILGRIWWTGRAPADDPELDRDDLIPLDLVIAYTPAP
jgi:uncharacterized protein with PQ loop repeat